MSAALVPCSCIYDSYPQEPQGGESDSVTYLTLSLDTGESVRAVSGVTADDEYPAMDEESTIHSVKVWAFDSSMDYGSALPFAYLEADGSSEIISVPLPKASTMKSIDLYVLVNGESGTDLAGMGNSGQWKTRGELEAGTVSGLFGVASGSPQAVTTATDSGIPATGLPMSRAIRGIPLDKYRSEKSADRTKAIDVPLLRAVSKIHFFFAKNKDKEGELKSFRITGIVLGRNEALVPDAIKVFPGMLDYSEEYGDERYTSEAYVSGNSYNKLYCRNVSGGLQRWYSIGYGGIGTKNIKSVDDPLKYQRKVGTDFKSAVEYIDALKDAGISEYNRTYLRESDRALTGTIYYKFSGTDTERSVDFELDEPLLRNREYVIYTAVLNGYLLVQPVLLYQVVPWEGDIVHDIEFN